MPTIPGNYVKSALLVIAHGSPRAESNDDIYRILDEVRRRQVYDIVQIAFLECNDPAIADAVRLCVAAGANRIICVPYFLHSGRHVELDIPNILRTCALEHPSIQIELSALIGHSPLVTKVLQYRATNKG